MQLFELDAMVVDPQQESRAATIFIVEHNPEGAEFMARMTVKSHGGSDLFVYEAKEVEVNKVNDAAVTEVMFFWDNSYKFNCIAEGIM